MAGTRYVQYSGAPLAQPTSLDGKGPDDAGTAAGALPPHRPAPARACACASTCAGTPPLPRLHPPLYPHRSRANSGSHASTRACTHTSFPRPPDASANACANTRSRAGPSARPLPPASPAPTRPLRRQPPPCTHTSSRANTHPWCPRRHRHGAWAHFVSIQVGDSASLVANDRYGGQPLEANQMRYAVLSSSLPDASLDEQGRLSSRRARRRGAMAWSTAHALRTAPLDCGDGRAFVTVVTVPTITFSADRPTVQQILQPPPPPPPRRATSSSSRASASDPNPRSPYLCPSSPGILGAPQPQMDAIFESAYAASPAAAGRSPASRSTQTGCNKSPAVTTHPKSRPRCWRHQETIAHYAKIAEAGTRRRRDFWSAVTQAPDGPNQQKLSELNAQDQRQAAGDRAFDGHLQGRDACRQPADAGGHDDGQLSMLVNAVSEAIIQRRCRCWPTRQLVAERAAIDGFPGPPPSSRCGHDGPRPGPAGARRALRPDESALLDHVASVVRTARPRWPATARRAVPHLDDGAKALRAAQGGGRNLAVLFDVGHPPPDFTMRAMAMAGLDPAGSSGNAALTAVLSKSPLLVAGQVLDNTGLRLARRLAVPTHLAPPTGRHECRPGDGSGAAGACGFAAAQRMADGHAPASNRPGYPVATRDRGQYQGRPAWTATNELASSDRAPRASTTLPPPGRAVMAEQVTTCSSAASPCRARRRRSCATSCPTTSRRRPKIFQAGARSQVSPSAWPSTRARLPTLGTTGRPSSTRPRRTRNAKVR